MATEIKADLTGNIQVYLKTKRVYKTMEINAEQEFIKVFYNEITFYTKEYEDIVYTDAQAGIYKKIVLKDNKLEGAIFLGDIKDYRKIYELIKEKALINGNRQDLVFGSN